MEPLYQRNRSPCPAAAGMVPVFTCSSDRLCYYLPHISSAPTISYAEAQYAKEDESISVKITDTTGTGFMAIGAAAITMSEIVKDDLDHIRIVVPQGCRQYQFKGPACGTIGMRKRFPGTH
jgi:hypothetical protein